MAPPMQVGFVLEEEQPVLLLAVHITLDLDGAGVDLLALVQILEDAALLQGLGGNGAGIHQRAVFLVAAGLGAQRHVAVKSGLHHRVVNLHVVQNGAKGGVAAVVGPVGVDQADFGDGGVAVLGLEVILAENNVGMVHGQALFHPERLQRGVIQLQKAGQRLHRGGDGKLHLEGVAPLQGRLAGFHRVDDIFLDGVQIFAGEGAFQQIHSCAAHVGALALAEQLDALGGGIRPLVKLAGQILHGKDGLRGGQLVVGHVHRRLAEYGGDGLVKQVPVNALHIVAVEQAQALEVGNAHQLHQLMQQALGLAVKTRLFFHINTIYHETSPYLSAWRPARGRQCRCACASCQRKCGRWRRRLCAAPPPAWARWP